MKTTFLPLLLLAWMPVTVFAAKDAKRPKKPAAGPDGAAGETLKTFDKNGDHKIDADELPALQKAFSMLKNLDKNNNGEIELAEVEQPKKPAGDDRKSRMLAGLKEVDKNGNRKIDADEVEGLQKMLAGGKIMSRLDQNGNGKLEADEVELLNKRIAKGGDRQGRPADTPAPSVPKAPEKPVEAPKPEETKEAKPAETAPEPKPPGNFGT